LFLFSYIYNSQAVPEPDEFNSINFDQEQFIQSQKQINPSLQSFLPLWPLNFHYPSYIPISISNRKSFEIDDILDLSLHNRKRKRLSTDEDNI
jgi:hypothetical protein